MKTLFHAIGGFATASIIAWGGLICWGAIFLKPGDSYRDRTLMLRRSSAQRRRSSS